MADIKKNKRINRGEVSDQEVAIYSNCADFELIELLKSSKPTERTCAAKLLGSRKSEMAISDLCLALKTEKSIYPKIAISEALGEIGLAALPELIKLLGKIGNNQHKELPEKAFEKSSYPLPRDIAARTITKIGENALELLIKFIPEFNNESLSEAIDAIGFISYYSGNYTAFKNLSQLIEQFRSNDLITWKLVRSLQSFSSPESVEILEFYKHNHPHISIRNEAERSLLQIFRNEI
jgi:HEAT repeat protein